MGNIQYIRKCTSLKRKLDAMIKKFPEGFIMDHGVCGYLFHHYVYKEGDFENNYTERITIYVEDFDSKKSIIEYMSVTDDDLRRPKKDDWGEFVSCSWDKRFPSILEMREYHNY